MNPRAIALALALVIPLAAPAQVAFPEAPAQNFADETRDWGVAPTKDVKRPPYHAPTPLAVPGGRVIRTVELDRLLQAAANVVVIDVLDSRERRTVPGAAWLPDGGQAPKYAAERSRFEAVLSRLTGGDKSKPLIFLCLSSECWLSYNASLDAIAAGYTDVIWYRGGTDAWRGASLRMAVPQRAN